MRREGEVVEVGGGIAVIKGRGACELWMRVHWIMANERGSRMEGEEG